MILVLCTFSFLNNLEFHRIAFLVYCRKGDYYRYLAEFKTGDDKKEAADQSMKAYQVCIYLDPCLLHAVSDWKGLKAASFTPNFPLSCFSRFIIIDDIERLVEIMTMKVLLSVLVFIFLMIFVQELITDDIKVFLRNPITNDLHGRMEKKNGKNEGQR